MQQTASTRAGRAMHRSAPWPCPRPSVFSVLVVHHRQDVVLHLSGNLDASECAALSDCVEELLAEGPRRLMLELSALERVDADGTEAVRTAAALAHEVGVELVLECSPPLMRETLAGCPARFR